MQQPAYISLDDMPRVPGLAVPADLYTVLKAPGLLAGMRLPDQETPWDELVAAGFSHVVCLTDDEPSYDPSPVRVLHAVALQDLYGGVEPREPEAEIRLIAQAIEIGVDSIRRGEGLIVHCHGGTGRTGTILAGMLCSLGESAAGAIARIDAINRARGGGWPESRWQAKAIEQLAASVP